MAAVVAAAVTLPACTAPAADSDDGPVTVRLYGSDGIMQDDFTAGLADPAVLAGMKGTAPMSPLPTEFTNRLLEIDSSLDGGFLYAGETYDAVVIGALAAELAGTTDPGVVRNYVNTVTSSGERCTTVAACLELARAGVQLEYRGVSLRRGGFTDFGEPATASYATLHFGARGVIDQAKTEFVGAGDLSATTAAEPPAPGPRPEEPSFLIEPLRFGGLLPETGALSYAYPPMAAGAQLAIDEINEAGGVFGVDVEWHPGDDGTLDVDVALATLAEHLADEVHIVIGAGASATTEAVLPEVVAAGRILISPASTRADLRTVDDDGYFFRTAPPDDLQGAALADIILRDGAQRVVIVAQDEPYARGLQTNVAEALGRLGIPAADVMLLDYPPPADGQPVAGVATLAEQVVAADPDGVVVIGFGEAASVIEALFDAGIHLRA